MTTRVEMTVGTGASRPAPSQQPVDRITRLFIDVHTRLNSLSAGQRASDREKDLLRRDIARLTNALLDNPVKILTLLNNQDLDAFLDKSDELLAKESQTFKKFFCRASGTRSMLDNLVRFLKSKKENLPPKGPHQKFILCLDALRDGIRRGDSTELLKNQRRDLSSTARRLEKDEDLLLVAEHFIRLLGAISRHKDLSEDFFGLKMYGENLLSLLIELHGKRDPQVDSEKVDSLIRSMKSYLND